MDYGRPLAFGYFPSPAAAALPEIVETVRLADELGLELVGIQDHPYQRAFVDTWALIASLLPQTRGVTFFPDVTCVPLRPPAVLAKTAASLDLISAGRFELGLGAGSFWSAIAAMGGPRRSPGESVDALAEAIHVIRLMWSGEAAVRHQGRFYSLNGVKPGPQPAHAIGIWIGSYGPRMLRLTGRLADGWVPSAPYLSPGRAGEAAARVDEAARAAGRDPAAIRRLYNVWGTIQDAGSSGDDWEWPAERWVETLTRSVLEDGMDSFVFGPARDPVRQLHRWAEEVAPAVRANVERSRR